MKPLFKFAFFGALASMLLAAGCESDGPTQNDPAIVEPSCPSTPVTEFTIIMPDTGRHFSVGDSLVIKWCNPADFIGGVKVAATIDDGVNWIDLPGKALVNVYRFVYTIPESWRGKSVYLQIENYSNSDQHSTYPGLIYID